MKKVFLFLIGVLFLTAACTNLDEINEQISDLDARLKKVESDLSGVTATANGLSTAVRALQNNVSVDRVTENENGYVITFTDGTRATIYNGKNGKDGKDGHDGKDGKTPNVGVATVDGEIVWTVNGEAVKDTEGKTIPATAQVPEFQFDGKNWFYRFGTGEWVLCNETAGDVPEIIETEDSVIISIGGNKVIIPKEIVSPAIESITPAIAKLFVPVGKSLNLQEWFEVAPEGALKSSVDYTFTEGAPFTITEAGVLSATGRGSYNVNIVSKADPSIKGVITVRTAPCPVNVEPAPAVNPDNKVYLFDSTLDFFKGMVGAGGSATWNPFNNSISALVGTGGAGHNVYIRPQPVDSDATLETGHLHFMYYISDVSKLKPGAGQVELTSSANPDAKELNWSTDFLANCKNGWNEIVLDFKNGHVEGEFDPANINWFRFFNETTVGLDADDNIIYEAIQVKDIFVYADKTPIEGISVKVNPNRLFVPVGKSIDLKEWFDVTPANAKKSDVTYSFSENAPFTITDGVLAATGRGNYTVTLGAEGSEATASIVVRTAPAPDFDKEVTPAAVDAQKFYLFSDTSESFPELVGWGGSFTWAPMNNAAAALVGTGGAGHNIYFKPKPVNAEGVTMKTGHLHFLYYISDVSKLKPGAGQVELTSGANPDTKELGWSTDFLANCKSGWNEVVLDFKNGANTSTDGPIDLSNINWFRFYNETSVAADDNDVPIYESIMVKDIYVYATPAPLTVTEMLALDSGTAFTAEESLVAAVTTRGFIATDGSKAVYVYTNSAPAAAVGDKVTFKGKKTVFNGVHEIESVSDLAVVSSGNLPIAFPEPKDITSELATYTNTEAEFVCLTATLAKSGNYYNLNVDGVTTKQGSIVYPPAALNAASFDGKMIKVTGYFNGLSGSGGKFVNVVATKIEEVSTGITIDGDMSDWAAIEGFSSEQSSRIREWKFSSDDANVYIYCAMRANRADNSRKLVVGFNTDNDAATGSLTDNNNMKGCEALANTIIPFTNASGASALTFVNGVDAGSKIFGVGAEAAVEGAVTVFAAANYGDLSSDSSNVEIELSIPKDKLNLPAGAMSVACSYDYYWTGFKSVTL